MFDFLDFADVLSVFRKLLSDILVNTKIDQVIGQQLSDQEFCGNVVELLLAGGVAFLRSHCIGFFQQGSVNFRIAAFTDGFAICRKQNFIQIHTYLSFAWV